MRDPWGGESESMDRLPPPEPPGELGASVWADPWAPGVRRWAGTTAQVPLGDSGSVRVPVGPAPAGPSAFVAAGTAAPSGGGLPPPVEYPDDWRPRGRRGDGPGRGATAPKAPKAPAPAAARTRHGAPKAAGGGGFLRRAAAVTAGLTAAGAVLGLVRDQSLAHYFGAGAETDAFLVAWTVPEFASTLLIEDAMALILVPAFSRALTRRGGAVRALVRSTLPRLVLAMSALAGVLILGAPLLVSALAPGLPDPQLAVDCTRLTATCVLTFALAGYCSAALRAHGSFLPPAAIYVAYNIGIIGTIVALREPFGVRAAAAGVAVGGALMVAVQAPYLIRELRRRPAVPQGERGGDGRLLVLGLIAPVIAFTVSRQSQILIERFLAAPLPSGAISHLNYAQKVAQMPMILSLMLCTVSFPVVARAMAAGDDDGARRRVERDLLLAAVVVLVGASVVIAAAPQIVEVLFQRGAFDDGDTAATAAVMRVYALGLLGQTMVGTLVRCYFSAARPLWFPAAAMAVGLAATAVAGVVGAELWGAVGIAAANALGITLTAVLMLLGAHRQAIPVRVRYLGEGLLRLATAASWATAAGWLCSVLITPALLSLTVAAVVCVGVFLLFIACAARAPDIPPLTRTASRRLAHARCHGAPHRRDPSTAAEATPVGGDVPLDRRPHG
ncbi:lipid II flippase MurJ [Streptomyces sp. NPDC050848]|uniref:murein biosynthesis integral membrane protein MurJ n=1 Tax=Streptomyces sp. NPDC050848 TaxID=3155791 RepID=UPI0033D42030